MPLIYSAINGLTSHILKCVTRVIMQQNIIDLTSYGIRHAITKV